ncbi:hypothetical protein DFH08DRAFT_965679 [Mycena albidolilacea]|uniref:DUF6532 domain-containing protein n=1 Tax=Mycena albidolilacea TaxID=1033008 RepID=A0AAD6ZR64_9AGAR|nr:hypothetical protein DFH08DRAFT_965679 [Mycena albidolilacea]
MGGRGPRLRLATKSKVAKVQASGTVGAKKKVKGAKSKETKELEKVKAQLAAANKQLLLKRNQDMLDAEDLDDGDKPPANKRPKVRKTVNDSNEDPDTFGEDDIAALNGVLGSGPIPNADEEEHSLASDDKGTRKSPVNSEDDQDVDDSESLGGPAGDDDMLVDKVTPKKRKRRKRTSNSSTTQPLSSSRVTQASFTPTSLRVANAGRYAVHVAIATEHAFPSEREDWTWGTLEAAMPKESSLAAKLALIKEDDDRTANLITYVYLFSLKRCQANTHIEAYGGAAQLRGQNIFKYGGVDIKKRTFDPQQPTVTKGVRVISAGKFVDLVPLLTLVTDAMESSLKEYSTGVRIKIKFSADDFAARYDHHRAALDNLKTQSPVWFDDFQRNLYSCIVKATPFTHLQKTVDKENEELADVDFAALEASVSAPK